MSANLISNFLKTKYDKGKVPHQVFEEFPTLARIPKRSDGGGDYYSASVVIGNPMGLGPTLAIAQAGATQGSAQQDLKGRKWIIPWGDYSASVNIEDKDIKRSRNNEVSFINWLDEQITGLQRSFLERLSILVFAETGRYLGTGTISTGVITLGNAADVIKFPIGSMIVASANDGSSTGHTLLGSGSIGYVFAQDEGAGTVTVATTAGSTTAGTPASWTGTMYLFANGDFGGSGANTIFPGLGAWLPPAAPTGGDSFNNVDRSVAPSQLAGFRLLTADVAGLSIRQRITKLVTIMNTRGTTPGVTDLILNPEKWQMLVDELQAQGSRVLDGQGFQFNTSSIKFPIGGKVIEVVSDRHCPIATCFALTMPKDGSNIVMPSIDELPHVISEDGLQMLRSTTANTYEHRLQCYPSFVIKAPGWCGRCPV